MATDTKAEACPVCGRRPSIFNNKGRGLVHACPPGTTYHGSPYAASFQTTPSGLKSARRAWSAFIANPAKREGLKVYGFQSFRQDCPEAPNGSRQTREIVAAKSLKAAKALAPEGTPLSEIVETGNAREIHVAMSYPGVVFWEPLDNHVLKLPFKAALP